MGFIISEKDFQRRHLRQAPGTVGKCKLFGLQSRDRGTQESAVLECILHWRSSGPVTDRRMILGKRFSTAERISFSSEAEKKGSLLFASRTSMRWWQWLGNGNLGTALLKPTALCTTLAMVPGAHIWS